MRLASDEFASRGGLAWPQRDSRDRSSGARPSIGHAPWTGILAANVADVRP
jgi:hypothetical protein